MPTFSIQCNDRFMYVHSDGSIQWVKDKTFANTYTSKYQAKRHKQTLDNVPPDAKIVEMETIQEV